MPSDIRNRRQTWELSESDVTATLERIAERDAELAAEARHVYDTLTWGEGPAQIRQAGVQRWLWYQVPTKYLTDEVGYMAELAEAAAALFDELGLDAYAAICRSERTERVHAAFERSDGDGFAAMRTASDEAGIEPPDLDGFVWGDVMGIDEASARTAVENALESAIHDGDLVVGGRGWRARQRGIAAAALDSNHPERPDRSWRTAVVEERVGEWVRSASRHSEVAGQRAAAVADRLLHPIEPPPDLDEHLLRVTWLLDQFGDEQALTEAGYLNRSFVLHVHDQHPWVDPYPTRGVPRSESDEIGLHPLRVWLESVGALRRRGKALRRTRRGAAMATEPRLAWEALTLHVAPDSWDRWVLIDAALILLDSGEPVAMNALIDQIVGDAADRGWQVDHNGESRPPGRSDVTRAYHSAVRMFDLFGFIVQQGDWSARTVSLPPAGESTMLAILRADAAGPKSRPW